VSATVLIVENDPDIRELIEFFLTREGFRVLSLASGREVLQVLEQRSEPMIVLTEINLPLLSGERLLAFIEQHALAHVRVFFLTSRTQEKEAVRMLEMGAEDFLRRPFYPRELIARLKKIARRLCAS